MLSIGRPTQVKVLGAGGLVEMPRHSSFAETPVVIEAAIYTVSPTSVPASSLVVTVHGEGFDAEGGAYTYIPTPYILDPAPYILNPTPYIRNPTPDILNPTPDILNPTPDTFHHTPYPCTQPPTP